MALKADFLEEIMQRKITFTVYIHIYLEYRVKSWTYKIHSCALKRLQPLSLRDVFSSGFSRLELFGAKTCEYFQKNELLVYLVRFHNHRVSHFIVSRRKVLFLGFPPKIDFLFKVKILVYSKNFFFFYCILKRI